MRIARKVEYVKPGIVSNHRKRHVPLLKTVPKGINVRTEYVPRSKNMERNVILIKIVHRIIYVRMGCVPLLKSRSNVIMMMLAQKAWNATEENVGKASKDVKLTKIVPMVKYVRMDCAQSKMRCALKPRIASEKSAKMVNALSLQN